MINNRRNWIYLQQSAKVFQFTRYCNRVTFFFPAEDGIRDLYVTGVQTCALPISVSNTNAGNSLNLRFAFPISVAPCEVGFVLWIDNGHVWAHWGLEDGIIPTNRIAALHQHLIAMHKQPSIMLDAPVTECQKWSNANRRHHVIVGAAYNDLYFEGIDPLVVLAIDSRRG